MKKPCQFKIFSANKTFEENRTLYRFLCKKYHPDQPGGGDTAKMQEVNDEWGEIDTPEKFENKIQIPEVDFFEINFNFGGANVRARQPRKKEKIITFKGRRFDLYDENIREKISYHYGGLGLIEFLMSNEWQEHINS